MDASPDHSHARVVIERAYTALIREARRKPFEWGSHDCVLFAASVVLVRTGRDALAELGISPVWKTAHEAQSAIDAAGGLNASLTRLLGKPLPILRARSGDLALASDPDFGGREILTVVHGGLLLAPAEAGLGSLAVGCAIGAWRVE